MRKFKLLSVMMLSAIVAFTSCNKDELAGSSNGKEVRVTLSTQLPTATPQTRAVNEEVDDIEGFHLRYILEVWTTGATPQLYDRQVISAANKKGDFDVRFLAGQTYNILLWSDYVHDGQNPEGKDLNEDLHYLTSSLKAVTKNTSSASCYGFDNRFSKTRDAFYGYKQITADADVQESITLSRAVAQLNIYTTDFEDIIDQFRPLQTRINMIQPQYFDVSTGIASGEVSASTFVAFESVGGGKYKAYTGYFLANGAKAEIKSFVADFIREEANNIAVYSFSNIPIQRNYRTNITGALLTKNGNITVETESAFNNPDDDLNVSDVSSPTPAELQTELLAKINAGTLKDDYHLTARITQEVSGNFTIDLTKKSGMGDVLDSDLPRVFNLIFDKDITSGTTTIKFPEAYSGIINVKTQTGKSNVTIDAPGASVTTDGTYGTLTVSSRANTCNIAPTAIITTLNIEKGNLIVPAKAVVNTININEGAGSYAEYAATAANVTINVKKNGGHHLRMIGGSASTSINVSVGKSNVELLASSTVSSVKNTGDASSTVTIIEGSSGTQELSGYAEGQIIRFVGYTDNIANSFFLCKNQDEKGMVGTGNTTGFYAWSDRTDISVNAYSFTNGQANTYQAYNTEGINCYAPNICYAMNKNSVKSPSDLLYYLPSAVELRLAMLFTSKSGNMNFATNKYWSSTVRTINTTVEAMATDAIPSFFKQTQTYVKVRAVAANSKLTKGYPYLDITNSIPVVVNRDGEVGVKQDLLRTSTFNSASKGQYLAANNLAPAKFRVAKQDLPTNLDWYAAMNYKHETFEFNEAENETGCAVYSEENGGSDKGKWRVPTFAEWSLLGIMGQTSGYTALGGGSTLGDVPGFDLIANVYYHTATESKDGANVLKFAGYTGYAEASARTTMNKVRCVRDVE